MGGLGLMFRRRAIQAHPTISEGGYILSAEKGDAEVFRILMEKGVSSDGVGITKEDAAKVTSISTWFQGNTDIVSFPELIYFTGISTIGKGAFNGCSALRTIDISNATTIGDNAFYNCTSLGGEYELLKLDSLGSGAFRNTQISSIIAPNVTTLYANTFNGCKSLINADFRNVVTIGSSAFNGCSALRTIDISNATTIGISAFSGCVSLNGKLDLRYVTSLGDNAFYNSALTGEISLMSLMGGIGSGTFRNTQIISIIAPFATAIGSNAFSDSKSLTIIDISNVTSINASAFSGCKAMIAFICRSTNPPSLANANAFSNTNNCPIYVPDSAVDAYMTAENWSTYAARIKPLSEYQG